MVDKNGEPSFDPKRGGDGSSRTKFGMPGRLTLRAGAPSAEPLWLLFGSGPRELGSTSSLIEVAGRGNSRKLLLSVPNRLNKDMTA
jgi:hypothetical protein